MYKGDSNEILKIGDLIYLFIGIFPMFAAVKIHMSNPWIESLLKSVRSIAGTLGDFERPAISRKSTT